MYEQQQGKSEYLIVEFIEEKDENGSLPISVISSNWIDETGEQPLCFWPTYFKSDKARNKAILEHEDINFPNSVKCAVNIKYRSGIYEKALDKLKKLEVNSNVSQSDTDTYVKSSKRIVKRKIFEDYISSDSSDDNIPVAPKLKRSYTKLNPLKPFKNILRNNFTVTKTPFLHAEAEYNQENPVSDLNSPSTSVSTFTYGSTCFNCQKNEALIHQVMQNVREVAKDVQYLIRIVQDSNRNDEENVESIIKISSVEDMDNFNTHLEDVSIMTNTVCSCQVIGGKDVVDTTRRILTKLVSHDLSLQYNWSGRNEKKPFSVLKNIIKAIVVAVRKNPQSKNATQQEIEDIIKVWLRNAFDREGGRSKRRKTC